MLIGDTKESDIQQRLKDLEQFVLNLEQARLREWTRVDKLEKELNRIKAGIS